MKRKLRWSLLGGLAVLIAASLWGPRWQARKTPAGLATPSLPSSGFDQTAGPKSPPSTDPATLQNPNVSRGRQTTAPSPSRATDIDDFSELIDPAIDQSTTAPDAAVQDTGEFLDPDAESPATPSEDEAIPMDTGPFIGADVPAN